jgi:hypothetical protein
MHEELRPQNRKDDKGAIPCERQQGTETGGRGKPEGANEVSMRRSRHFSVDAFGKRVRRNECSGRGHHLKARAI